MAMGPERERSAPSSSKPLHNFNLPCGLRWGNQRFLRCMKVNSNGEISAVQRRPSSSSSVSSLSAAINARDGNGNGNSNVSSYAAEFVSIIGKRKEREQFDDPSVSPADYRRGSDFKKVGLNFKPPTTTMMTKTPLPLAAGIGTESGRRMRPAVESGGDGDGIAAVREKLMFDLQTAADKMKDAILREGLETEEQDNNLPAPSTATVAAAVTETAEAAVRPWNLRTRRAACKAPTGNGLSSGGAAGTSNGGTAGGSSPAKSLMVDLVKPSSGASPSRATENNKSSPRLRTGGAAASSASPSNEKKERAKFSVALSRQEIEEDFLAMAGRRPPRRPQKRSKYVQKNLEVSQLYPAFIEVLFIILYIIAFICLMWDFIQMKIN